VLYDKPCLRSKGGGGLLLGAYDSRHVLEEY
jgi:hypothetical protein